MPRKKPRAATTLAKQADPHALYEQAVQCAEAEIDFVEQTWRASRHRPARRLREDFCGTALVCTEWVARHPDNQATGIDLDARVLAWARRQHLASLNPGARKRIQLLNEDVLHAAPPPADIVLAMNFSYWLFKTRKTLRGYFERVREGLHDDGIFFLDAYGGYDACREIVEEREIEGSDGRFTYIWEQSNYNPIDAHLRCDIHFAFPDGSRLESAFQYDWRLWTLPEIRELLEEAGFRKVVVHCQGFDADGEADGDFRPATRIDADAGWICYLTAER